MTNKELINHYNDLLKLRQECKARFSAKVSYAITRNIRTLSQISEDITSTREEIIKQHGQPSDEKGYFIAKPGHEEIFMKEICSVDETESEGVVIQKISFDDIANVELSVSEMDALYFMIKEEEN